MQEIYIGIPFWRETALHLPVSVSAFLCRALSSPHSHFRHLHSHSLFLLSSAVVLVHPDSSAHVRINVRIAVSLREFSHLQEAAAYVERKRGSLEENKEGIEVDPISFEFTSSGKELLISCGHSEGRNVRIKNTSALYVSFKNTPRFGINPQVYFPESLSLAPTN